MPGNNSIHGASCLAEWRQRQQQPLQQPRTAAPAPYMAASNTPYNFLGTTAVPEYHHPAPSYNNIPDYTPAVPAYQGGLSPQQACSDYTPKANLLPPPTYSQPYNPPAPSMISSYAAGGISGLSNNGSALEAWRLRQRM
jgi:hypothetical protein